MKFCNLWQRLVFVVVVAIVMGVSGTGWAQTGQPGPLQKEFMDLQQRLAQAEQKAFGNTPELRTQLEDMEELFADKMRAAGFDPGAIMETLLVAQGQLETPGLSDARRREIMQSRDVVEAQRLWAEAQRAIMNDPEVQEALQSFDTRVKEAMRREEPEMDRILARMEEIQRQVMQQQAPAGRR